MMIKKLILICLVGIFPFINMYSQNCQQKLADAKAAERKGNYLDALRKFNATRKCDASLSAICDSKIEEMFKKIENLRIKAEKATREANNLAKIASEEKEKVITAEKYARQQSIKAISDNISYKGLNNLKEGDRTLAYKLASFTHQFLSSENLEANSLLYRTYYYNDRPENNPDSLKLPWHRSFPHGPHLYSADYSPNEKQIITSGYDGTIMIWEKERGKILHTYQGHVGTAFEVQFSPNDSIFASAGADKTLKLWKVNEQKPYLIREDENFIHSLDFSPKGQFIATGGADHIAKIWNTSTGDVICPLIGHQGSIHSVKYSSDGQLVATASGDKTVKLWDSETCNLITTFTGHEGKVKDICFSPDNQFILSASYDGTIRQWDIATRKCSKVFQITKNLNSVAISPDSKQFLAGYYGKGKIELWSLETGKNLRTLSAHSQVITALQFSKNGQEAISAGLGGTAKVWDLSLSSDLSNIDMLSDNINALTYTQDNNFILVGCEDGSLQLWNTISQSLIQEYFGHDAAIQAADFLSNEQVIISVSQDSMIMLWDRTQSIPLHKFNADQGKLFDLKVAPNGQFFFTAGEDGTIKMWNSTSFKVVKTFTKHKKSIRSIDLSINNELLVSGSKDSTLIIWDISTGKLIHQLGHPDWVDVVRFFPDNKRIVSTTKGYVKVWDIQKGLEQKSMQGHRHFITDAAILSDGKHILTSSSDKSIMLWDLNINKYVLVLKGHNKAINTFALSKDENFIASGGKEKKINIWKFSILDLLRKSEQTTYLTINDILSYGLFDKLEITKKWEDFVVNAPPMLLRNFAEFFKNEVAGSNNPTEFNRFYRNAITCLTIANTKEPNYNYQLLQVEILLNWSRQLLESKMPDDAEIRFKEANELVAKNPLLLENTSCSYYFEYYFNYLKEKYTEENINANHQFLVSKTKKLLQLTE